MPHRTQSANRLTEHIHAAVRSAVARVDLAHLLVACSGGADSTCLVHATAVVARQSGRRVTVCHVRHGVRADDECDAEVVRAMADHLGTPCIIVALNLWRADHDCTPSEAEMRDARYRALADVADEIGADAVLTGHTLDDQAETVLLHLLRGAGVDGLSGISEEALLPLPSLAEANECARRLRLIRPLLAVRRDETVAYCAAEHLPVVSDPTNADIRYTRNWLRHTVLPSLRTRNPGIATVLARTASTIRADAAFLSTQTTLAIARCDCQFAPSYVSMHHAAFASEHVALQRRMLRDLLPRITGAVPRAADIEAVQQHIAGSRSSALRRFGGVAVCLAFGRVVLGADHAVIEWVRRAASARYPLSQGSVIVNDDACVHLALSDPAVTRYSVRLVAAHAAALAAHTCNTVTPLLRVPVGAAIIIRNRLPADRFWPWGSERPMLLRDYLSARGLPAPVRDLLPLVVVNDTIAWVIGHDVSATFAAPAATATHLGILTHETGDSTKGP